MSARSTWLALVSLWVSTFVYADPSAEEEAFIAVPGAQRISDKIRSFAPVDLPKDLLKRVREFDAFSDHGNEASEFSGFTYDLNHDGKDEYFIYSRDMSGSGGPFYQVFAEIDGHWQSIMDFQGMLFVMPAQKGQWPKTVHVSRGGGGVWAKTYGEFKMGQYEDLLIEHYDRGKITKETLPRKK